MQSINKILSAYGNLIYGTLSVSTRTNRLMQMQYSFLLQVRLVLFVPPVSNQHKEIENEKYLHSVQYNLNKNAASYLKPYN